ncbi:MAG: hypothetical protein V9H25_03395 [Candidatus Competibacter sp.]
MSTGQPALINFLIIPSPLYITGQGREDVKRFQVAGVGRRRANPFPIRAGNNLQLQLLPSRPNGGEKLVAITASGSTQEGNIVNTRTINGIAEVALHSGDKPGTVADRRDRGPGRQQRGQRHPEFGHRCGHYPDRQRGNYIPHLHRPLSGRGLGATA